MKFGGELPARSDLSSLRLIAVAGEPLNPEACRWAFQHLVSGGRTGFVADNWWQTELGGPALGTPLCIPARPGQWEWPCPAWRPRWWTPTAARSRRGRAGCWPSAVPSPHDAHGVGDHERYRQYWEEIPGQVYAAGDVASWDEDGYFTVLGRSDDVLNVAGHRIGTADVESALVSHPTVAEAA